ncbi:MAG: response regulator transcription factor [Myxococcaceae bacterium]|nr:response regulator transcription factor [Myxococcaceae bacterium]
MLALALAGLSNRQISRKRKSSERTVAKQVASLFRKLEVGSRAELWARAAPVTRR